MSLRPLKFVPEELRTIDLCEKVMWNLYDSEDELEFVRDYVPEEFKEELAEKYDIDLPEKGKGR